MESISKTDGLGGIVDGETIASRIANGVGGAPTQEASLVTLLALASLHFVCSLCLPSLFSLCLQSEITKRINCLQCKDPRRENNCFMTA